MKILDASEIGYTYNMNVAERQDWLVSLRKIESIAKTNKLKRFLSIPGSYIFGQLWTKAVYPVSKQIIEKKVQLFFGMDLHIPLPTGLDIYLLGAKTHDSEIRLARFFIRHVRQGDTIFDIGAHLGYFTLLSSKLTGETGKVFAWEASPKMYRHLQKNIQHIPAIFPQHAVMSSQTGSATFHEFPIKYSEYNSMNADQYKNTDWFRSFAPETVEVKADTLDHFTNQYQVFPYLIKIDVEGAEEEVLKGATKLLSEKKPIIVMEFLHADKTKTGKSPHQKAAEILKENGYLPFIIQPGGLLEQTESEPFIREDCDSDNIVFIHPENPVKACL